VSALVLGKFLPPHLGHVYLVDFARYFTGGPGVMVVVGTLAAEPIPGALRHRWMQELFPELEVIHLTDENPQAPEEHPDFWRIWRESLERVMPQRPELVFASEQYGWRLAGELGARFVPVDQARRAVPISGTRARSDPGASAELLPECVRRWYGLPAAASEPPRLARKDLLRVCIFGPESTGKTTLAEALARHYRTIAVPEYARTYLEAQGGQIASADLPFIGRGQLASEDALAWRAERVLFTDTDLLTTRIWSQLLFGVVPTEFEPEIARRRYDLTLLLDPEGVPWVGDPVRYLPDDRRGFFERCADALLEQRRPTLHLTGSLNERLARAITAVDALLKRTPA
jgi:NadR type nicotinamide-nucleotide adenylyltransferase